MVSSDFGQLAVNRHLTSGIDCATAGAASADAAIPAAPTLRNSRRFMDMFLLIHGPLVPKMHFGTGVDAPICSPGGPQVRG